MRKALLILILMTAAGFAIVRWIDPATPPPAPPASFGSSSRLSELLGSEGLEGYSIAREPRTFSFPGDHGPHRDFRNEWWYLTGNLDSEKGQRFGFELTFFRFSLQPVSARVYENASSRWQTDQVFIAHFAVTDEDKQQFHVDQRFSRGALGLAGAQTSPFRVWIEDWFLRDSPAAAGQAVADEQWQLSASVDGIALNLNLVAMKPPVLNGLEGLSRKSAAEGNASYYYSIPRMRSTGTLQLGGETHAVSGISWLDREWSSSALAADQQGWDWFALQLSDGSDLMFYNIRRHDGSQDQHSAGTWVSAEGDAEHLSREDVEIEVTGEWTSAEGGTYPARWDIRVKSLGLRLTVTPVMANQELITTVRYWEGAVDVEGGRNQQPLEGRGYVELTGYAE